MNGYQIVSESKGTETDNGRGHRDILVRGPGDLASIPADTLPGSIAHTAGYGQMWEKGLDGSWVEFGG